MNENHLHQIFDNYIDRFEEFNNVDKSKPSEYYKWEMPLEFQKYMNEAMNAPDEKIFVRQLNEIKKVTHDFIDSGKTLPFAGLTKLASEYKEWASIQKMFQELYVNDGGDLNARQRKIETFEVVEEIENYPRLKELDPIRSALIQKDIKEEYPDAKKHVLAYDIIYCYSAYGLSSNIKFIPHTPTERKLLLEKQQKALELLEKLKNAQEQKKVLDAAMEKVGQYFSVGQNVTYKSFGKAAQAATGTIVKRGSESVTIDFDFGEGNGKTVGLIVPIVNGYIRPQDVDENDFASVVEILKNKSTIENKLSKAEREFAPYSDYI